MSNVTVNATGLIIKISCFAPVAQGNPQKASLGLSNSTGDDLLEIASATLTSRTGFSLGVLVSRFGSLESDKIIIGSLESEKIGSNQPGLILFLVALQSKSNNLCFVAKVHVV